MTGVLPDSTLLGDAKAWLRARLRDGDRCPLCDQRAQLYRRAIGSAMSIVLLKASRDYGTDWFHLPTIYAKGGDTAKLRYWGLLEEEPTVRPDGGRAGYWRITEQGLAFAHGTLAVPRWALVYDGRCLGFEGEHVTITDTLPKGFDLDALLQGVA